MHVRGSEQALTEAAAAAQLSCWEIQQSQFIRQAHTIWNGSFLAGNGTNYSLLPFSCLYTTSTIMLHMDTTQALLIRNIIISNRIRICTDYLPFYNKSLGVKWLNSPDYFTSCNLASPSRKSLAILRSSWAPLGVLQISISGSEAGEWSLEKQDSDPSHSIRDDRY